MKWSDDTNFIQAPVGNHVGRCVSVIDIGTQRQEFQGEVTYSRQVIVRFELPTELVPEGNKGAGKPFVVQRYYSAKLSRKASLRKDLEAWQGRELAHAELKDFDPSSLLGRTALVNVGRTVTDRAKVVGLSPVPKGLIVTPQVNTSVYFSLEPDEFVAATFADFGDGLKELIMKSPEYMRARHAEEQRENQRANEAAADDDDIPF
jgi:hypothetical protein